LRRLAALAAFVCTVLATPALAETYTADPVHTSAEFTVSHLALSRVKGIIPVKSATVLTAAGKDVPTSIEATLDPSGLDSRDEQRDSDLKSPHWLDVAKYPTITFKSTSITSATDGTITINGNLTIHGTTKPVTLLAHLEGKGKDNRGNDRIAYTAQGKIDRREYGIVDQGATPVGNLVVGNDITISLEIEAVGKK